MKSQLAYLKNRVYAAKRRAATLALMPFVLAMSHPAFAELPVMPTPGTGIGGAAVADGDWLNAMGAWFKAGITIFGLVIVGLGFIYVLMGALGKWRAYSMGRAEIADLKEYMIMAAVLGVFLVMIATYAFKTIA